MAIQVFLRLSVFGLMASSIMLIHTEAVRASAPLSKRQLIHNRQTKAEKKGKTSTPTQTPSFQPSASPSISAMPTSSTKPSASPSISMVPSLTPSLQPTSSPSKIPSSSPSTTPTSLPSASPSLSASPTIDPIQSDNSAGSLVSTCTAARPETGISDVAKQLVTYEVEIQLDRTRYQGTANAKVAAMEPLVHVQLQQELLQCNFDGTRNPEVIRLDSHTEDTVDDVLTDAACPVGVLCWVVAADFTIDMFYYDSLTRGRRQLQSPMATTISDSGLLTRLGQDLATIYANLDTGDGTVFRFRGFSNAAATDTLGEGNLDDDNGGVAAAEDSERGIAEDNNGAVAALILALAALVLIAVTVFAVQRRRRAKTLDKGIMLENGDVMDAASGTDLYAEKGQEYRSNLTADDILADLQSLDEDQEVSSSSIHSASAYSRQVYVLSEMDNASLLSSHDPSLSDPNWTPDRYGINQYSRNVKKPTFVKATDPSTDLKQYMKDLDDEPRFVRSNRSYLSNDTVNL